MRLSLKKSRNMRHKSIEIILNIIYSITIVRKALGIHRKYGNGQISVPKGIHRIGMASLSSPL